MADQRLVWRQLTAPDLSAASQAMARAGAAFSDGMDSGSSILAKYAEGQQAKADDAILGEIAGLKDEAAFDAFISGGGLAGRNISQGMREHILGMRSNFVNDEGVRARTDGTRASTANTRANTGISLARESRSAAEWQDNMARRDAERAAAGDIEAARAFSAQYGDTVGPITETTTTNTRDMLARTLQAEAGNQGYDGMVDVGSVIRNRAASGRYGQGIEGVIMKPGQFSAWNGVTGYAGGEQGQDMTFTPTEEAYRAADAILSGQYTDATGGATHYYNPDISQPAWGSPNFIRRGSHVFGNADGGGAVQGNTGPIAGSTPYSMTTERASPVQAARQGLLDTGLFTAAEVDQMMAGATQAGRNRSDELLAADQAAQAEAEAQIAMTALLDPNNLSSGDMARGILADPSMSAQERMRVLETATGLAESNPGVLAPDPTQDPNSALALGPDGQPDTRVEDIATGIKQDLGASLAARPQSQLVDDIDKFSQEDPAQALESVLGLGSDRESDTWFRDYDQNDLRNLIRDYAKEFGVDEPTAAAAMRQAFERDPWGRNTMENRFDKDRVGSIIEESLSQDQISGAREDRRRASQLQTRADSIVQRINLLQTQARKGGDRSAIAQEIANLTVELTSIRSEASQLFGTPSGN